MNAVLATGDRMLDALAKLQGQINQRLLKPASNPADNRAILRADTSGVPFWGLMPFFDAYQGADQKTNLRVFTQWQNSTRSGTQDGQVTFYPTTTGDASGSPLFSAVLFASAQAFAGAVSPNDTRVCGGRSVAADLKSVGFDVTRGSTVVLGGTGLQSGNAGTPCCCFIVGVAA